MFRNAVKIKKKNLSNCNSVTVELPVRGFTLKSVRNITRTYSWKSCVPNVKSSGQVSLFSATGYRMVL